LADIAQVHGQTERFRGDAILHKAELFKLLEDESKPPRRLIGYVAGPGPIDHSDAAPFGSMLDSIGDCDRLDLLLHSGGGSGEVAEKLVEMCRSRCRREFRVIVPNYAKSAATMVALGGESIVMAADRSELGPIDPQYEITVGNERQQVSGQSFLQAYELAQQKVREASEKQQPVVGYLQSLAASTMEPAFIEHCRRENLLSARARFSHGRLIGPEEARDEVGLNIEIMDRDDPVWQAYWELYVRAEVYMQWMGAEGARAAKLFFDRDSTLPSY
jgi:ClpP class serine protease